MRPSRDEAGAVAIMTAVLAVVLLSIAAMAVDLGSAYVERRDVQSTTDLAALAGAAGNNLPGTTQPAPCLYGPRATATDQAVVDVANHLASKTWTQSLVPADLVDCKTSNGEVFYGTVAAASNVTGVTLTYNRHQLTVMSPRQRVDFGFAQVMGFSSTEVSGRATVEIKSPAVASVPLYAFTGCDYGRQTLAQPNNGHVEEDMLDFANQENVASLTALMTSPSSSPPTIPVPAPDPSPLTVSGQGLTNVTRVGFFEAGTADVPGPFVTTDDFTVSGDGKSIQVHDVPAGVRTVPGVWYIRVKIADTWSEVQDNKGVWRALPLTVGNPTLTCGQGSNEGNFGSLRFPGTDVATNIARGLEHTLAVHPSPAANWTCSPGQGGVVVWPAEGTNCVGTDPGMVLKAAQQGFIEGVSGTPGRLTRLLLGTGCAASGAPATEQVGAYTINNDTLSCFLTDATTNLGTISSATYGGAPVFSPKLFSSPRFVMVPVLGVQPGNGASKAYQIVDFRPGFITDQPNSATRDSPVTSGNGLTWSGNTKLNSVRIVFINAAALPPMESVRTTSYAGSGPRVIRLVD